MCLAQGPQCSDTGEAQTRNLSVSSQSPTTEPLRSRIKDDKFKKSAQDIKNRIKTVVFS